MADPTHLAIANRVAAQITAGSYAHSSGTLAVAYVDWPPEWDDWSASAVKVVPDTDTVNPMLTGADETGFGVIIAICEQRTGGTADLSKQLLLRENIRKQFIGKRLGGTLTDVYCTNAELGNVYDQTRLQNYQFVSGMRLTFTTRETRS